MSQNCPEKISYDKSDHTLDLQFKGDINSIGERTYRYNICYMVTYHHGSVMGIGGHDTHDIHCDKDWIGQNYKYKFNSSNTSTNFSKEENGKCYFNDGSYYTIKKTF